jgi:hypothetical protein
MEKKSVFNFLFILNFIFVSSCAFISGEGPIIEREVSLTSFSGVELDGSFDVSIDQGVNQRVLVVGNENIIEKVELIVSDGVVHLSLEPGSYLNYDLEVRITVPDIESAVLLGSGDIRIGTFVGLDDLRIELDGSGDIVTNEESVLESTTNMNVVLDGSGDIDLKVKAAELNAALQGSGDIDLTGVVETLKAELDGSGDIKAYDLKVVDAEAVLDGSGSIRLFLTDHLRANLDGSGDITYRGAPVVEQTLDGSGTISPK